MTQNERTVAVQRIFAMFGQGYITKEEMTIQLRQLDKVK